MKIIDFLANDGIKLDGFLYQSIEKTNKIIISIHGMTSNCFKERDKVTGKLANDNNIDYFCFNNRGSELVKYINKNNGGKLIGGTIFEDVLDGYKDILGAIEKVRELGYNEIYLQGHSLGCTKIVYTYNRLLEENNREIINDIKGVILLSLVDIIGTLKYFLGKNYYKYVKLAEKKEKKGKIFELMPKESFIYPVSVKTFLRYAKYNKDIDFANYDFDNKLEILNKIELPLFMRWGNNNEMILQKADELVYKLNKLIKNENRDINFIDGANHSYYGKENILAEQIIKFIQKK